MTEKAQINSVALFFFFALLEEGAARTATSKTYQALKSKMKSREVTSKEASAVIVYETWRYWRKNRKKIRRGQPSVSKEGGWIVPAEADLGPWKQFQKESDEEEFLAVLWSRVLKISDQDISKGLGVTLGTVRHRVGRGLRKLGELKSGQGVVHG